MENTLFDVVDHHRGNEIHQLWQSTYQLFIESDTSVTIFFYSSADTSMPPRKDERRSGPARDALFSK